MGTLPLSTKTPQVRGSVVFGTSGSAPGSAAKRVLLIGSMITAALVTPEVGGTAGVVTGPSFPFSLGSSPRTVIATIDGVPATTVTFTNGVNAVDTTAVTAAEWNAAMAAVVGARGTVSAADAAAPSITSATTGTSSTVALTGTATTSWATTAATGTGVASTSVTTAAGSIAVLDRAYRVTSADHAKALAGQGSELHLGVITALAQNRNAEIWIAPVTYGSTPLRASVVITPAGSVFTAGVWRITVAGYSVDIPVTSTSTLGSLGYAAVRAINAQRDWPVTATNAVYATGAVTLSAKCAGPRGNALTVRCALLTATDTLEVLDTTARTAFGLTITLSGGTADGGVYRFSGGAVDDDVTALLAAIAPTPFYFLCMAAYRVSGSASANHARLTAYADERSEAAGFAQQVEFGTLQGYATSITDSQALNVPRMQWPSYAGGDDQPLQVAAAIAVARLLGDGQQGGVIEGEDANPACNLNGLELVLRAPRDPGDLLDAVEVEACLNAGVTPLMASPTRPGRLCLVASVCGRSLVSGTANFAVYKTKDVTVADYARAFVVADLLRTYRGFNLVADQASGRPPTAPRTTTPGTVRGRIYQLCKTMEKRGILRDVDATAAQITATVNVSNPRRVDWVFPSIPPQDFDIADGTIYQQQPEA